ncbi:MAG TPA: CopD family protein [Solirubrobacteraceae bacterium]|nr:CopD family protein [Solirubrobacteraceae bacterium]
MPMRIGYNARTAGECQVRWRALSKLGLAIALVGASLLAAAPVAFAHAQLLGTSPLSGSTVPKQPAEVIFKFNQAIGGTLGAVRVYNAQGEEVDNLDVGHPEGKQHWMGVGLKPKLPDGTYTGTYRVISADTHIVYGGLVFNIGHAGAAPKFTVAGLIDRNKSGRVTEVAFGVVRGLDYLSLALGLGGLAFLLWAWLPGFSSVAGSESGWQAASRAFAKRLWLLLIVAVALGIVASVLGILLQGASAAGVSLWASLKAPIVNDTLKSRFGEIWGLRGIVWVALGSLLIAARLARREAIPVLRAVTLGADGTALGPRPPRALLVVVGVGVAFLAMTPALSGHASVQSPTAVFFPIDVIHVLAASVWVGGIACLLLVLPAATRQLEAPQRSRLLMATLARFSPLALACVIAIATTGVVQAYIDVRSFEGLFHTTYGALVIVKVVLLTALIGLGWINRERILPALRRIAAAAGSPGAAGVLARRTMRGELALMLVVFGVTAALVSYAPPIDAASGPFSTTTSLGPAELEMTVEPARVGLNTIHLYLIDAKSGAQFTATKELTVTAKLPAKGIGPLPLQANLAGPGHYALNSAELSLGGTWQIRVLDRVSEFEEYEKTVSVPIR